MRKVKSLKDVFVLSAFGLAFSALFATDCARAETYTVEMSAAPKPHAEVPSGVSQGKPVGNKNNSVTAWVIYLPWKTTDALVVSVPDGFFDNKNIYQFAGALNMTAPESGRSTELSGGNLTVNFADARMSGVFYGGKNDSGSVANSTLRINGALGAVYDAVVAMGARSAQYNANSAVYSSQYQNYRALNNELIITGTASSDISALFLIDGNKFGGLYGSEAALSIGNSVIVQDTRVDLSDSLTSDYEGNKGYGIVGGKTRSKAGAQVISALNRAVVTFTEPLNTNFAASQSLNSSAYRIYAHIYGTHSYGSAQKNFVYVGNTSSIGDVTAALAYYNLEDNVAVVENSVISGSVFGGKLLNETSDNVTSDATPPGLNLVSLHNVTAFPAENIAIPSFIYGTTIQNVQTDGNDEILHATTADKDTGMIYLAGRNKSQGLRANYLFFGQYYDKAAFDALYAYSAGSEEKLLSLPSGTNNGVPLQEPFVLTPSAGSSESVHLNQRVAGSFHVDSGSIIKPTDETDFWKAVYADIQSSVDGNGTQTYRQLNLFNSDNVPNTDFDGMSLLTHDDGMVLGLASSEAQSVTFGTISRLFEKLLGQYDGRVLYLDVSKGDTQAINVSWREGMLPSAAGVIVVNSKNASNRLLYSLAPESSDLSTGDPASLSFAAPGFSVIQDGRQVADATYTFLKYVHFDGSVAYDATTQAVTVTTETGREAGAGLAYWLSALSVLDGKTLVLYGKSNAESAGGTASSGGTSAGASAENSAAYTLSASLSGSGGVQVAGQTDVIIDRRIFTDQSPDDTALANDFIGSVWICDGASLDLVTYGALGDESDHAASVNVGQNAGAVLRISSGAQFTERLAATAASSVTVAGASALHVRSGGSADASALHGAGDFIVGSDDSKADFSIVNLNNTASDFTGEMRVAGASLLSLQGDQTLVNASLNLASKATAWVRQDGNLAWTTNTSGAGTLKLDAGSEAHLIRLGATSAQHLANFTGSFFVQNGTLSISPDSTNPAYAQAALNESILRTHPLTIGPESDLQVFSANNQIASLAFEGGTLTLLEKILSWDKTSPSLTVTGAKGLDLRGSGQLVLTAAQSVHFDSDENIVDVLKGLPLLDQDDGVVYNDNAWMKLVDADANAPIIGSGGGIEAQVINSTDPEPSPLPLVHRTITQRVEFGHTRTGVGTATYGYGVIPVETEESIAKNLHGAGIYLAYKLLSFVIETPDELVLSAGTDSDLSARLTEAPGVESNIVIAPDEMSRSVSISNPLNQISGRIRILPGTHLIVAASNALGSPEAHVNEVEVGSSDGGKPSALILDSVEQTIGNVRINLGSTLELKDSGNGTPTLTLDSGVSQIFEASGLSGTGVLNVGTGSESAELQMSGSSPGNFSGEVNIADHAQVRLMGSESLLGSARFFLDAAALLSVSKDGAVDFSAPIRGTGTLRLDAGNAGQSVNFPGAENFAGTIEVVKGVARISSETQDADAYRNLRALRRSTLTVDQDATIEVRGKNNLIRSLVMQGGTLNFSAALSGDTDSSQDQLRVQRDASGEGKISVTNLSGTGARTASGIVLLTVEGRSTLNLRLASPVSAGLYFYRLGSRDDQKEWFLYTPSDLSNAEMTGEAVSYAANASTYGAFDMKFSDRRITKAADFEGGIRRIGWVRVEGSRGQFRMEKNGPLNKSTTALTQAGALISANLSRARKKSC